MLKHISRVWLGALAAAWIFDFLFWRKTPGISFAIFVAICLIVGFILAAGEDLRPARTSLLLLLPIGFFAVMSFIRQEPFTLVLNYGLTLSLMALFVSTFLGGQWIVYSINNYILAAIQLILGVLIKPGIAWTEKPRPNIESGADPAKNSTARKLIWPVVRGLAFALPVVAIFAALLASADLIFSQRLSQFIKFFAIENLPETIFRVIYILLLAYAITGIYLQAFTASREEHLKSDQRPALSRFIGFTESSIVLGSLDLLFAFFVIIQLQYFFGGQANINVEGFTFSEYARRGFGELVVVAVFSLLLFLGLSALTNRAAGAQRKAFSALGIGLFLLLAVILVSAFQRLMLYEQAYGFTSLRTYTHIFMIWLGALLLAVVGLEIFGQLRYFALAALVAALGFSVTLNIMNVDGFIVRQNVARTNTGEELDTNYLTNLSTDAIPTLAELYSSPALPETYHSALGGILACQAVQLSELPQHPWQSFTLSRFLAQKALNADQVELNAYPLSKDEYGQWMVKVNGKEEHCTSVYRD